MSHMISYKKTVGALSFCLLLMGCSSDPKDLAPTVKVDALQPGWAEIADLSRRLDALEWDVRRLRQMQASAVAEKPMVDAMMMPMVNDKEKMMPATEHMDEDNMGMISDVLVAGDTMENKDGHAMEAVEMLLALKPEAHESETLNNNIGVHLASYREADLAKQGWTDLLRDNTDILGGLTPIVATLDIGGSVGRYYRLKAIGFVERKAAAKACQMLEARHYYCVVTDGQGDPI